MIATGTTRFIIKRTFTYTARMEGTYLIRVTLHQPQLFPWASLTDWSLMAAQGAFCAVETKALNVLRSRFASRGRDLAQDVSRRPLTAHIWVRSYISAICEDCGRQSRTETHNSRSTSAFPCQYHSPMLHTHPHSHKCSYQKDKQANSGNLRKKRNAVSNNGE